MNNLDDLKEQIQEDIMCYIDVNESLLKVNDNGI